ncbi:uncharacterized protein J4E88_004190 [Alternaria novae-zelandiae]|uniref:uncharacterized protein n=1 Tax=Alternaria novae-zelandiae TaxID=430562 RepID=UPI0020C2362E|nr:uncharacterized protein J4E88_004190 [Alternaria novae-zelandiae]KAI4684749.1 hypothetical protein J4E88_004190 [Alternaria novae-zelandiae]
MVGTAHLWHLIAFAIHQIRANGQEADPLFRQQQALLRTLPTPSSVVAEALKLWWAWRRKADRPFLRSVCLVLIAVVFTTMTIAASVFSSLIVDTGAIEVLVDPPFCGSTNLIGTAWRTHANELDIIAPAYTQDCYSNGSLPVTCNVFTKPNVPLTVENVPCPFNDTMCDTEDAVSVDSGLVDVGKAFGLNLPSKDRVTFRKKIECTVLPVEGYYDVIDLKYMPMWKPDFREIFPGEQVAAIFYGPTPPLDTGESFLAYLVASNVSGNPKVPRGGMFYAGPNNTVLPTWFPKESFYPLSAEGPEGDVFWKPFLPNSLEFGEPVDDPLYSAHKEVKKIDAANDKPFSQYLADHPIKGVGCTQHLQYCHARDGQEDWCTRFEGVPYHTFRDFDFPEANSVQRAVLQLIVKAVWLHATVNVMSCKVTTMMSRGDFDIPSVPNGFWKQEVLGWEQEVWAAMQIQVSQHASGPQFGDPFKDDVFLKPETEGEKALCGAQKMRKSGGFVNINVFGLSFIIAFSVLVAIIDITLLKFLVYLTRFRRALGPRIARWTQDGVWQLQRRAYEGEGHRNWTDLESEIPLMEKGHKLKDLPIMWRPGKSPMMAQTSSFASTNSIASAQQSVSELAAEDVETAPVVTEPRRGWFGFARR